MSEEKPTLADVLFKNRKLVLAMLGVPVFGMLIAAGLIIYTQPSNMIVALGVILFVGIQYIMMMFFWMKRVEKLAKNKTTEKEIIIEEMAVEPVMFDADEVLEPEEKRVLPVDKE
jgi:positive regulator of sigma E activity